MLVIKNHPLIGISINTNLMNLTNEFTAIRDWAEQK